jgi:hypothetical protein
MLRFPAGQSAFHQLKFLLLESLLLESHALLDVENSNDDEAPYHYQQLGEAEDRGNCEPAL